MKIKIQIQYLSLGIFVFSLFAQVATGLSDSSLTSSALSDVLKEKQKENDFQKKKKEKSLQRKKKVNSIQFKKQFTKRSRKKVTNVSSGKCTKELLVQNAIGPATLDSLRYSLNLAKKDQCSSLLLLINTPGGNLLSTRKIVEVILDSDIPILCLVHPTGAHAGSAGAIILQACHLNGAIETTNLGAATPIVGSGKDLAKDLRKKMINDTTSWLDSLTELRKRSKEFGRDIITNAKAVNAKEAYRIGAIDFFGKTKEDFLSFAHGQKAILKNHQTTVVKVGPIQKSPLGMRYHFVNFITDPEMVYLLFIGSLLLIYFEITHPGTMVPGVLGAMGLVLSFIGMHKLNFVWGGLFLIGLALIFMVLEFFVTSFGVLSIAGVVSFIFGSFFLFDPSRTGGVSIPSSTILVVSALFSAISLGVAYLAFGSLKKPRGTEEDQWIGLEGQVVQVQSASKGLFEIKGETWKYHSSDTLKVGDTVQVLKYSDMVFQVQKQTGGS